MASWGAFRGFHERLLLTGGENRFYSERLVELCVSLGVRWASKKAAGSTRNGRKSAGRRLGLKCSDGGWPHQPGTA